MCFSLLVPPSIVAGTVSNSGLVYSVQMNQCDSERIDLESLTATFPSMLGSQLDGKFMTRDSRCGVFSEEATHRIPVVRPMKEVMFMVAYEAGTATEGIMETVKTAGGTGSVLAIAIALE